MPTLKKRDELQGLSEYFLTNRVSYLVQLRHEPKILPEVLRTVIATSPHSLQWNEGEKSDVSFTARENDGHVYSINALDWGCSCGRLATKSDPCVHY